ncbi:hypothetical protein MNB_SM-5-308 [hydrothermal vent metagenome]|uniref:Chemotaxis phosphatase CheX-like domain-containing protein n=1 Tax=hydrothermal vent metagenome TaxID=652676 RepID=A0A1W1BJE0_9ZZZZ
MMIENIENAAKNFCIHQLGIECQKRKNYKNEKKFIASIDIIVNNGDKYRVFIAANKAFIQGIATLFLEEEKSDMETLQDMTLESANLIVGSAKVIAEESENPYEIGTPFFESIAPFDINYDTMVTLANDTKELIIAVKRLDA